MKTPISHWLGRPIVDAEDAHDLERRSAIHEFSAKMPRHEAEGRAYEDYVKDKRLEAAAHHLAGMKAAQGAGSMDHARKHGMLYELHMKALDLNPHGPVPPEVTSKLQSKDAQSVYRFKAHRGDHFALQDHEAAKADDVKKSERGRELLQKVARDRPPLEIFPIGILAKGTLIKFPGKNGANGNGNNGTNGNGHANGDGNGNVAEPAPVTSMFEHRMSGSINRGFDRGKHAGGKMTDFLQRVGFNPEYSRIAGNDLADGHVNGDSAPIWNYDDEDLEVPHHQVRAHRQMSNRIAQQMKVWGWDHDYAEAASAHIAADFVNRKPVPSWYWEQGEGEDPIRYKAGGHNTDDLGKSELRAELKKESCDFTAKSTKDRCKNPRSRKVAGRYLCHWHADLAAKEDHRAEKNQE